MYGHPITVQEWNKKYSTLNGKRVVKALLHFHEHSLELQVLHEGIDKEVDFALRAIGVDTEEYKYVALSLEKFSESILASTPEQKKKIVSEARTSFKCAARRNLGALCRRARHYPVNYSRKDAGNLYEELTESLGNSLQINMYRSIEKKLDTKMGVELRDEICRLLYDAAYHGLFDLIFYQVAFLIHGELERARNMERLIEFFKKGSYLCGVFNGMISRMENKNTFLGLVE